MQKQDFGIIGLGVMGKNLSLNAEGKGFSVSVYDSWTERVGEFIDFAREKNIIGTYSLQEFTDTLKSPRKILIMVKAGKPVDDIIEKLLPLLDKEDIIIDGGNSYFIDTVNRSRELEKLGIHYIGTGVSGGEEGALNGPALMPGGNRKAYEQVEPIFTSIAAKVNEEPCCTYIGSEGAGHYVKMVHNGIEYADMQLIAEAYSLLKNILGLTAVELHNVFTDWNKGELNSYLIEITADIFANVDSATEKPTVDIILDAADQKGTGKWTSQSALDLGVAIPTITEAVFARSISTIKDERVKASKILPGPTIKFEGNRKLFIESVRKALYASKICSYAQGFTLLKAASKEYEWGLNYGNIAMIFRGGCIIRAQFLEKLKEAFDYDRDIPNIMLAPYFKEILENYQYAWREVVAASIKYGVPVPALSSALCYFDSYRSELLPANLIQAQRDYFGAHTFQRIDAEGTFHNKWI